MRISVYLRPASRPKGHAVPSWARADHVPGVFRFRAPPLSPHNRVDVTHFLGDGLTLSRHNLGLVVGRGVSEYSKDRHTVDHPKRGVTHLVFDPHLDGDAPHEGQPTTIEVIEHDYFQLPKGLDLHSPGEEVLTNKEGATTSIEDGPGSICASATSIHLAHGRILDPIVPRDTPFGKAIFLSA